MFTISRRDFMKTVTNAIFLFTGSSLINHRNIVFAQKLELNPSYGGILSYRLPVFPQTLDPHHTMSSITHTVVGQCYNRLLTIDAYNQRFIPEIAEKWEVSEDGRKYTFYLRKNIYFHNKDPLNARELTSADVKFTYERLLKKSPFRRYLRYTEKIEPIDKYKIEFTLRHSFAPFLNYLSMPYASIVTEGVKKSNLSLESRVLGTGPFILEEYVKEDRLIMRRNQNYWKPGFPYLDGIEFKIIPEEDSAIITYKKKKIDLVSVREESVGKIIDMEGVISFLTRGYTAILIRNDIPPLDNPKVRQAISLSIDRQLINEKIAFGQSGPTSIIPPGLKNWTLSSEETHNLYKYDPERAKKLLKEAGYSEGFEIEMQIVPRFGKTVENGAYLISKMLEKVGIKINLNFLPNNRNLYEKNFTMYYGRLWFIPEPDVFTYLQFHSEAPFNYSIVKDSELNKLLEQQRRENYENIREKIIKNIQRYIAKKNFQIPILYLRDYYLISSNIMGFRAENVRNKSFENVWKTGFVRRVRIIEILMDYSDPKEPKCIVKLFLASISNLQIKIYYYRNKEKPILAKTYLSEPAGYKRVLKIPLIGSKGRYYLWIEASNIEGLPQSVCDEKSFTKER